MDQKQGKAKESAAASANKTKENPEKKLKTTHEMAKEDFGAMGDSADISKTQQSRRSAESLVERINLKRQNDLVLIEEFKTVLLEQVEERVKDYEKALMDPYQDKYEETKEKFDELFGTMDRTEKLEKELTHFHSSLDTFFKTAKKSDYAKKQSKSKSK